jgi:predicted ATP-binding protein involved in virulence
MQLKNLTLSQFRGFEEVQFDFVAPGMNLLVGINGVGKSSVLDAVRIAFSRVLPQFTASEESYLSFTTDDIRLDQDNLTIQLNFMASGIPFEYRVSRRGRRHKFDLKPHRTDILVSLKAAAEQPLVLYFSTQRSMLFGKGINTQMSAGNQSVAFVEALQPRMLNLTEFTDWWLVQKALANEVSPSAQDRLEVLQNAVTSFLEWCTNLRVVRGQKTTLLLDKDGVTFDVFQLSDGERSILALVLELARRLAQANPKLDNPLRDGKAIVLIDELDLHLHPQWQRTVAGKLTETFPSCQFIATTHSPQIIGEVKPPGLNFLERRGNHIAIVQKGQQGYGLDTSWILEQFMGTSSRNAETQALIDVIEDALEEGDLEPARKHLDQLKSLLHGDDNETIRLEASIDNLEALADEVDFEED